MKVSEYRELTSLHGGSLEITLTVPFKEILVILKR